MFALLESHSAQSGGEVLSDIRTQLNNVDRISPLGIGGWRSYPTPGGLRGRLCEKNDVSVGRNQGLKDIELVKVFMCSNVFKRYRFKGEVIRRTATVDFFTHLALGLAKANFRGCFPSYLRAVGRKLKNEFVGHNSRWDGI